MARLIEHRCGQRFAMLAPAELAWGPYRAEVLIVEASSTGAFICTELRVPRWGLVEIGMPSGVVAAWVVRVSADGLGIGWREFAPREVFPQAGGRARYGAPGALTVSSDASNQAAIPARESP